MSVENSEKEKLIEEILFLNFPGSLERQAIKFLDFLSDLPAPQIRDQRTFLSLGWIKREIFVNFGHMRNELNWFEGSNGLVYFQEKDNQKIANIIRILINE